MVIEFDINKTTEEFCVKHGHLKHVMGLDEFRQEVGWCCPLCYDVDLDEDHAEIIEEVVEHTYKIKITRTNKENKSDVSVGGK